jgi:hypothetical protein
MIILFSGFHRRTNLRALFLGSGKKLNTQKFFKLGILSASHTKVEQVWGKGSFVQLISSKNKSNGFFCYAQKPNCVLRIWKFGILAQKNPF